MPQSQPSRWVDQRGPSGPPAPDPGPAPPTPTPAPRSRPRPPPPPRLPPQTRLGFLSCLVEIIGSGAQAGQAVRFLAATTLKNIVGRYWRVSPARGGVLPEEKAHLRASLLALVVDSDTSVALQVAVAAARVARVDYPREWGSLLSDLLGMLRSDAGDVLRERRVYLALHHVLKELASKRLLADQKAFHQVCADLFAHVWALWGRYTEQVAEVLPSVVPSPSPGPPRDLLPQVERWLLLLKVVRRLLVWGFPSDQRTLADVPAVGEVVPVLLRALQALGPVRAALRPAPGNVPAAQVLSMVDRGVIKLAKALRDTQEAHPWSFRLGGSLAGVTAFMVDRVAEGPPGGGSGPGGASAERLLVACMLFLHQVVTCKEYERARGGGPVGTGAEDAGNARGAQLAREVAAQCAEALPPARKAALLRALVERYLPLTAADLEAMAREPEQFHQEAEAGAWREGLRPCAEALFLAVLESDRDALAPTVVGMLAHAAEVCPPAAAALAAPGGGVPPAVLYKEAVYNAVGWGAYELHDHVDVSGWLRASLLAEATAEGGPAVPLRRRAVIVLGQWVAKLTQEDRVGAYGALLGALAAGPMPVRLAAVGALRLLVDDWGFYADDFAPFLAGTLEALLGLLRGAEEFETQVQAFHLLCVLVERLGEDVNAHAGTIMAALPGVWDDAEGQALLRVQVLEVMLKLVGALGGGSGGTYPLVVPMLRYSLDVAQPDSLTLIEDALQLWLSCLRNAGSPEWALLDLFPLLAAICEGSTEHVRPAMQLTQSCVLLGGAEFLGRHGESVKRVFATLLGNVNERGMMALVPTLELALRVFPRDAALFLEESLSELVRLVLSGQEESTVVTTAVDVFARVLLAGPDVVRRVLTLAAARMQADPTQVLDGLLQLWVDRFDLLPRKKSRKLSALALSALLASPDPCVLARLPDLLAHVTGVYLATEAPGAPEAAAADRASLGYDFEGGRRGSGHGAAALAGAEEAQGEFVRRQRVFEEDVVSRVRLRDFLKEQVGLGLAREGTGAALGQALEGLDPHTKETLQQIML